MAKQDVLDAINATIVPNGTKAINADSLRNLLTMMTENAGEGGGSGDGALRVIVPELMMIGSEFIPIGEFSPTSWEEMKSNLEQAMGVDLSEYDAAVKASFKHNANVAQQLIEKGKAGQGVSVVLDQTPYFPALMNVSFQMHPEMAAFYEDFAMSGVQPAGFHMQYMNATPEGDVMVGGDVFSCVIAPAGNIDLEMLKNYPSNMLIILNLDGSLLFEVIEEEQPSSGSGVVTFYVGTGGELSSEYKSKNAEAYNAYKHGTLASIVAIMNGEPVSTITPISISQNEDNIMLGALQGSNDGLSSMVIIINSDGSATLS